MLTKKEYEKLLKKDSWSKAEHDAMWEYYTAHPVILTPEEITERNKIIEEIFSMLDKQSKV